MFVETVETFTTTVMNAFQRKKEDFIEIGGNGREKETKTNLKIGGERREPF